MAPYQQPDPDQLREEGRADAVCLILAHMGRSTPWMNLHDLCKFAGVSEAEVKEAIHRMQIEGLRRRIIARNAPPKRRRTRALPDVHCQYCGKVIPRENRTGHPRTICNPPCPESKNKRLKIVK